MKILRVRALGVAISLALVACSTTPDHFYTLDGLQNRSQANDDKLAATVLLTVTIPQVVDRSELVVITGSNRVDVMDHERWAAPLEDQFKTILARDLMASHQDLVVGGWVPLGAGRKRFTLRVEVSRLRLEKEGSVELDARWTVRDTSVTESHSFTSSFTSHTEGPSYEDLAHATSSCVAQLALAISSDIPTN